MKWKSRRRRACSGTRSLKCVSVLLVLAGALTLFGCGQNTAPVTTDSNAVSLTTPDAPETRERESFEYPGDFKSSRLMLYQDRGTVAVGQTYDRFRQTYPRPPRAFELTDVPYAFGPEVKARGWITSGRTVAAALVEDHVVQITDTFERVNRADVEEAIAAYTGRFGEPSFQISGQGEYLYAFWNDEGSVLMVGNAIEPDGDMSLTLAIGHPRAMQALGMTPNQVQESIRLAIERKPEATPSRR